MSETREVTRFLWLPKRIGWKARWLVTATWEEEYMTVYIILGWYDDIKTEDWVATKWINEAE